MTPACCKTKVSTQGGRQQLADSCQAAHSLEKKGDFIKSYLVYDMDMPK